MADAKRITEVLVVGFDVVPGWEHMPSNPSNQGACLHDAILTGPPPPLSGDAVSLSQPAGSIHHIEVHITYYRLPASYPSFSTNIPALHESGEYDAFLHIGQSDNHASLKLEKRARRVGYTAPYPDGLVPGLVDKEKGDQGHGLLKGEENEQDEYKPIVDLDGMEKWLKEVIGVKVMQANNGGLVGCEYTFAASLCAAIRYARETATKVKPVQFIHVKPVSIQLIEANEAHGHQRYWRTREGMPFTMPIRPWSGSGHAAGGWGRRLPKFKYKSLVPKDHSSSELV